MIPDIIDEKMKESIMELKIWSGNRDIPSIHFESLQIWTYIKISGNPVKVQVSGNPLWTPRGSLPVLSHEKKHYCSFPEVVSLFSSLNVNPDKDLDKTVKSDIVAYTAMLKEKLYPAIQYTWWLDRRNFESISRPSYAKASTWPLNFYYPAHFESKANELLEALYSTQDMEYVATEVYADARTCLNSLSTMLGDKTYFFGDELTSFDATLYAYLCPILKMDFPSKQLESHIKGCINILKYVDRITGKLYPEFYKGPTPVRQEQSSTRGSRTRTIDKRTHIVISAFIALASVSSFAYFTGVLDFGKQASEDKETTENDQGSGSFYANLYS